MNPEMSERCQAYPRSARLQIVDVQHEWGFGDEYETTGAAGVLAGVLCARPLLQELKLQGLHLRCVSWLVGSDPDQSGVNDKVITDLHVHVAQTPLALRWSHCGGAHRDSEPWCTVQEVASRACHGDPAAYAGAVQPLT